jgi:hypothetical protein
MVAAVAADELEQPSAAARRLAPGRSGWRRSTRDQAMAQLARRDHQGVRCVNARLPAAGIAPVLPGNAGQVVSQPVTGHDVRLR